MRYPDARTVFFSGEFSVEFGAVSSDTPVVKKAAGKKAKGEAELLDQATNQLLKAVKQKMSKKHGGIDYGKLRKDGYSERFLERLENA
jgi:hypothetical protein